MRLTFSWTVRFVDEDDNVQKFCSHQHHPLAVTNSHSDASVICVHEVYFTVVQIQSNKYFIEETFNFRLTIAPRLINQNEKYGMLETHDVQHRDIIQE